MCVCACIFWMCIAFCKNKHKKPKTKNLSVVWWIKERPRYIFINSSFSILEYSFLYNSAHFVGKLYVVTDSRIIEVFGWSPSCLPVPWITSETSDESFHFGELCFLLFMIEGVKLGIYTNPSYSMSHDSSYPRNKPE